jgi:DNA-binding FrmR family transcriptional regulator
MKTKEQLINNISGQINGVKKMLEDEKDCNLILNQMKAAKSAMSSLMDKFIEESMNMCLKNPRKEGSKETMRKLFKEMTKK